MMDQALRAQLTWRKSRRSYDWKDLKCVSLAVTPDGRIAVRNDAETDGPVVIFTKDEVSVFFAGVRDGEFDDMLTTLAA